jgi:hypothetical protein
VFTDKTPERNYWLHLLFPSRKITDCIYSSWHLHLSYHHLRVWGFSSNTPRAVHPRQGYWSSPSGYCFFSSLCRQRMRGELKTFLSAAKHCGAIRRQQHCHAMMQQHDLLGRGDGAEQSGHGQVINLKNHHAAARAAQGGDGAEQSCRGQVINLKHTS